MEGLLFESNPESTLTEEMLRQLVNRFPRDAASRTLLADWAYKKNDVGLCVQALEIAGGLNPDAAVKIRILAR